MLSILLLMNIIKKDKELIHHLSEDLFNRKILQLITSKLLRKAISKETTNLFIQLVLKRVMSLNLMEESLITI